MRCEKCGSFGDYNRIVTFDKKYGGVKLLKRVCKKCGGAVGYVKRKKQVIYSKRSIDDIRKKLQYKR